MENMKYTLTFKVNSGFPDKYNANLPTHIRLKDDLLFLELETLDKETEENFKTRAVRIISREIKRISLLEWGKFRDIQFVGSEPGLKWNNVCHIPTGCGFLPVENPEIAGIQNWESNPSIEIKLLLWEKACSAADIRLIYAYLHMIWELCDLKQWDKNIKPLPGPLEEVPILRNLLIHSDKVPNPLVVAYLEIHNIGVERTIENAEAHLNLATDRLPDIKNATHSRILKDIGYLT